MAVIRFNIKVEQEEDGMLWGQVEQMPGCFASGENVDELQEALLEAIQLCLPDGVDMTDPQFSPDPDDPEAARQPPRKLLVCA